MLWKTVCIELPNLQQREKKDLGKKDFCIVLTNVRLAIRTAAVRLNMGHEKVGSSATHRCRGRAWRASGESPRTSRSSMTPPLTRPLLYRKKRSSISESDATI